MNDAPELLLALQAHLKGQLKRTIEIVTTTSSLDSYGLKVRYRDRQPGHHHTINIEDTTLTVKSYDSDGHQYHTWATDINDPKSIDNLETLLTRLRCIPILRESTKTPTS